MTNKNKKIIPAPILSLSAKIELFAKFLRKAAAKSPSRKPVVSSNAQDGKTKKTVKKVASKKIKSENAENKNKKSA